LFVFVVYYNYNNYEYIYKYIFNIELNAKIAFSFTIQWLIENMPLNWFLNSTTNNREMYVKSSNY
jgi:hypothetical protein